MDYPSPQLSHAALAAFSPLNQQRLLSYLTQLAAQRYAPATLQAIPRTLTGFLRTLPPERHTIVAADLTQTTPHDLTVFITVGQTAGLAPSTLNTKLSILAKVFAQLCDEGVMLRQPVHWRQHHLVVPQGLPKAISDADLVAFFQVIDSLRDRLLFLLMLRCGLRVSEACALTWEAVDLQAGTVRINRGKGQVDRRVYCSTDVAQAFQRWQRHRAPGVYVFPSPQRRRPHLFRSLVNRLMDQYLAAAGLTTHYSPHCLRHTCATHLLNAGVPLEVLKELMGHQSLHQTLRYAQLYDTTKRQQYDQAMATITQHQALGGHEAMADDTIALFCAYVQRRNYSPHTVDNYGRDLRLFFAQVAKDPCTVSGRDVTVFIEHQRAAQRTATTINRRLNAVQHFFEYLATDRQTLGSNPVKPSHFLRRGRPLPQGLSPEQVRCLFAQITHPLDHALYLLMLRCGLRVSEVARLTPADLDWDQQSLRITQGKGRKDRIVYVAADVLAALRTCGKVRPAAVPDTVLFWNQKRPQHPLSSKGIQKKLERYAKAADIKASCHSLRHTFASNLLEAGAEVIAIKDLLGHASIQSSERYAKLSNQRVKQVYQQTMRKVIAKTRV